MSRPYFNIDNLSYAGPTLSMSLTYFKLRNNLANGATFSIDGFSNSIVVTVNNSNATQDLYDFNPSIIGEELPYDLFNLNVGSLGTSSTTTYTQPTLTFNYSGTVSATTNLKVQILGVTVINATSSAALAPTASRFLSSIIGNFNGAATGFSFTSSANSLIFTAPTNTGNSYNGITISNTITQNGSSFATASANNTVFSGGLNNYTVVINYLPLGPVNVGNEVYYWSN
jgi:hypothetical protein